MVSGIEDYVGNYDSILLDAYSVKDKNKTPPCSLKFQCVLSLLVRLFKNQNSHAELDIASVEMSLMHTYALYSELSEYIFINQFYLARKYFGGDLSPINSSLRVCISSNLSMHLEM